jgi:hypothetical protein
MTYTPKIIRYKYKIYVKYLAYPLKTIMFVTEK